MNVSMLMSMRLVRQDPSRAPSPRGHKSCAWRRMTSILILIAGLTRSGSTAQSPSGTEESVKGIESTREALAKWIETQKIISQEEAGWKTAKVALDGRIALVQQQIDEFTAKITRSDADIKAQETRKAGLERDLASAKDAPKVLLDAVVYMEGRMKALQGVLPEPVFKKVQGLFQRIPEDPNNT